MPPWTAYVLVTLGVVTCGLVAWVVVLQIRMQHLHRQHTELMTGASGANLEELLSQYLNEVRQATETVSDLESRTRTIERTLHHTMQWMGMIRFNPFRNTGGAQSFALAIVDGNGDGVVISSLHARENTRVYAKPLHRWASEHTLTEEEQQAIARAQVGTRQ